jgi:hypothetical protein
MGALMDLLSGAGAALDVPGSMVRDTLGGRNPFDQLATPFSWDNRLTGRDLLRTYGLAGEDPTGANMAGGVLAEMALDPLTWAGLGAATKLPGQLRQLHRTLKGRQAAKAAIGPYLGSAAKEAASSAAAQPAKALSAGMRPATAASFASPALGAYFIGDNMTVPPEEQEAWKNWLGAGLMAAPLAMAAGRGARRLSDILGKGKKQPMLPGMETPVAARSAATPAATPAAATPPAGMVTLSDAFTEHHKAMRNYLKGMFWKKNLRNPDTQEELVADAMARVWESVQGRRDMAFVPAGEKGWEVLKPFLQNRGKNAIEAHFGSSGKGRGKMGSPASKYDAYKLKRVDLESQAAKGGEAQDVGTMHSLVDDHGPLHPKPLTAEQEVFRPTVYDILETGAKENPKVRKMLEAVIDQEVVQGTSKWKSETMRKRYEKTKIDYKQLGEDLAAEGIVSRDGTPLGHRTLYNWVQDAIQNLTEGKLDPDSFRRLYPVLAAILGLGGATGGALGRRVAAIPEMPEPLEAPLPAAGPFGFASVDGQPLSPRWA